MKVILVGSPNVGKTTLFNSLTGSNQRVGNFSGTTVGFKKGFLDYNNKKFEFVDTPGLYTLYNDKNLSITDKMVRDFIINEKYDLIINVITADNLHSNLLLTCNLLDLAIPIIVILNVDGKNENTINIAPLQSQLGCTVLKLNLDNLERLNKKRSLLKILQLNKKLTNNNENTTNINNLIKEIVVNTQFIPAPKLFYGLQIERKLKHNSIAKDRFNIIFEAKDMLNINKKIGQFISRLVEVSTNKNISTKKDLTHKLDNIFLNKFLGVPIFLIIMYIFFYIVISVGSIFQDFIDQFTKTIFVNLPSSFFNSFHLDNFITTTFISIGATLEIIATFIPLLFMFYLCLGFLENSGYMSRGAYLTDGIMRRFGLPGKSLISIIISFGCAVPGVLSSRTISNNVERILTIVALPFIACSARLTVFILFVAIFFPHNPTSIIYFLYVLGLLIGIFTVWFFKATLFKHKESFFILELPKYRMPKIINLIKTSLHKVKDFCFKRIFKIILPIVIILNILHYAGSQTSLKDSYLIKGLHSLQILFVPMGITYNNWEAPISLVGGAIAKETVVTSLNTLYLLGKNKEQPIIYTYSSFLSDIKDSFITLRDEFKDLINKITFKINTTPDDYSTDLAKAMRIKFGGTSAVLAYLIFTLLYTPCLITLGAVRKEIGNKWMHFINTWSILVAYIFATVTYQVLNFSTHPMFSGLWILGCLISFIILFCTFKRIKLNIT